MAKKKKTVTPEDIIESIKEKQSEIDDLLYDLEDKISVSYEEEEEIDETDEE
jgi:hypothetical protein